MEHTKPTAPQWERTLRNLSLASPSHRFAPFYVPDVISALAEIDALRARVECLQAAAVAALETKLVAERVRVAGRP